MVCSRSRHAGCKRDKALVNMTQLHRTDNIWLLSSAKLLSLGLSFYLIYRHELESVFTWQRQQMCLENQRAHLQSVRLWDCWQRARILVGLVYFVFNDGKWQFRWQSQQQASCYQEDLQHRKNKKYIKKINTHISAIWKYFPQLEVLRSFAENN